MPTYTFPIDPVAASRPRVSRYSTYYTGKYAEWRKDFPKILSDIKLSTPTDQALEVTLKFFVKAPAKTELNYPDPDIDNYQKALFDSCNGFLWKDDRQIVRLRDVEKMWAEGDGAIEMTFKEIGPFRKDDNKATVPKVPVKRKRQARK